MIVKVQLPVDGEGPALIYTEGRKIKQFAEVTEALRIKMGPDLRRYFDASLDGKCQFVLGDRLPNQPW